MLNEPVRFWTEMVCPDASQASGMPRPIRSVRVKANELPLVAEASPSAANESMSARLCAASVQAYGLAPK